MIELTIKTLDSQNHHFTVPNDYTVEQLKEHIADTIQIPSEFQRCIYLGQVLQNETKLSDCDVNGKVLHVVQRPPPSSAYASNTNENSDNTSGPPPGRRTETHTGTMYLGAMAFPPDFIDATGFISTHPRNGLPMSRIAVARNLLPRAVAIINQLESENYFSSSQEQSNQTSPRQGTSLSDDINNVESNNGVEQPEVEIRIELPDSQHNNATETVVGGDENADIQDSQGLSNGNGDQPSMDDFTNTENSSNTQSHTERRAYSALRDEATRRRGSRTMGIVMGEVLHAQIRLIPFMRLLRRYLMRNTAFGSNSNTTHTEEQVQTLYNSVSELMHFFSHIYHALSDIMCDFSEPPPRTLRCRPVILQQQHATVLHGGPRTRSVIRSPLLAVARNVVPASTTSSVNQSANLTASGAAEPVHGNAVATSSVEVVIEEADTTNMQDNSDEVTAENMDVGEPIVTTPDESTANPPADPTAPTVTMRSRNGNTYVIQSMPAMAEGGLPEGIRINSVEATILTPNEEMATNLTGGTGTNQRWRAGILPGEVLQNMFGIINQFRQSHRQQRGGSTSDGARQPNSENSTSENNQSSTNTNDSAQSQNNNNDRPIELDFTGYSRWLDPFLTCHSHHIHPVLRSNNSRNTMTRNSSTQASSSAQSTQLSQTQSTSQSTLQEQQQQSSRDSQSEVSAESQSQERPPTEERNEGDGGFNRSEMPLNVTNLFRNMFPGVNVGNVSIGSINIGNVMIRRNSPNNPPDSNNTSAEGDRNSQGHSARRIQLTSSLNSSFPGAIQIEIDPLTHNIQNITSTNSSQSNDQRPRSRRSRLSYRRPRAYATSNVHADPAAAEVAYLASLNEDGQLSMSSSSSASASSLSSSDDDVAESTGREKKKAKKENQNEFSPSKTVKNFHSIVQKETVRHLMNKRTKTIEKETSNNHYPLYKENQEASLLEVINSVVNNTSFEQIIRGSETNANQLTSSVRQKIRNYLTERRTIPTLNKESLLNAVNVLINNDLYKMRNLLDSDNVKQEIDLVSTICKFNQDSVPELIEYIIKSEDLNEDELKKFHQLFQFYIARLLTLFVHCISGDDKSINIRKVLGSVVDELIKGLPKNEALVLWLKKDLINHVISYSKICYPENLPSFMKHYVVYRLPPVAPVTCTVATAITNNGNDSVQSAQPQPMEVEDAAQSSSASSEASFVSLNSDETSVASERAHNEAAPAEGNESTVPNIHSTESLPEVVLNTEDWHQSFSNDWVPIIARDIHRLRRQASQPPFSDAYLSGMPTKRRKLIKSSKPDLRSSEQLIAGNISTAINSAGFSSSLNAINQVDESSVGANEATLSEIAKEELKENIRENMVQQADFLPHRFPDATKYFMEK